MPQFDLKLVLLVFGIAFLVVLLTRKAIRKVKKDQEIQEKSPKNKLPVAKLKLSEEQFNKSWKSLSYLLLLAAAGNLYMVYTASQAAISSGLFFFWVDAVFSLIAAVAAFLIWRSRQKTWVYIYFGFILIPIAMFMSFKGPGFKESALIHLFPLVLLYFVLKPVWDNLKN